MRRATRAVSGCLASTAIAGATLVAVAPAAYLTVLTVVGAPARRPRPGGLRSTRFAILVPAHDEAAGIGATLDSFRALDYPTELFDVHVVADNCRDDTAGVVRRHGWNAHERDAPDDPGKGSALNWLFDTLAAAGADFDAVVIVDADTTVDAGFLVAMDREIQRGVDAAQGYYSVRDPEASATASFRHAALACRHHLRAQARCRLGASCGLYGNGMVFRRALLDDRKWSGHLVEDAEFQNDLLIDGHLVRYVPDAVVRAEMPDTADGAVTQNQRWERGRQQLARRYVPVLSRMAITERGRRLACADAVADHLVPPLSVLVGLQGAAAALSALGVVARWPRARLALAFNLAAIGAVVAHTIAGLASVRAPRRHYEALLAAPKIILWKIGLWVRVTLPGNDIAWTRTRRNEESTA